MGVAVSGAHAADLPFLRGSFTDGLTSTSVNWQGFYIGGQAGYGTANENFNGSTRTMAQSLLTNTNIESEMGVAEWNLGYGKQSVHATVYGAFAGYNWQWEDVVLSAEASWIHGPMAGSTSAFQGRISTLSDGYIHTVGYTGSSSISLSDVATFRGRAGYAFGCFLPYVFGGFALGDADIQRSVSIVDHRVVPPGSNLLPLADFTPFARENQPNHLVYGYSAGLGIDINLVGGLFMRAEYEYERFTSIIDVNISTGRLGLGYKF
jgi:opacity protein-like surface antigen